MLLRAERMSVLGKIIESPIVMDFHRAWQNVCLNQFHDVLGGVAIPEALDDAITLYREAIAIAMRAEQQSAQSISAQIDTSPHIQNLVVFNPSAFDRNEWIEFELWHPHASERGELLDAVSLIAPNAGRI